MGQNIQEIKPIGGMQFDKSEDDMQPVESKYNLNVERTINRKAGATGNNSGKLTPAPASRVINTSLPLGINTCVGTHESIKTNEVYVAFHNSQGNHGIYRILGLTLTTEIVLIDPQLPFSLDPKHSFHKRMHLYFNHNSFIESNNKIFRKYLVMTNGKGFPLFIDVETSVATNGFRVPYFNTPDRTQLWELPTRPALKCIEATFLPLNTSDTLELSKANRVKENLWQFRQQFIHTDGRPSAWGVISEAVVLDISVCQTDAVGLPRCISLKIDAGGPGVEKIKLAFRNCPGNFTTDNNPEWFSFDVVDKYEKCLDSETPFYERNIRGDLGYNPTDNTFTYIFCNDKSRIAVAKAETNLNFDPVPFNPYSLIPIENRLMLMNTEEGENPIDCAALDKIKFSTAEPVIATCHEEMVTVKFWIYIHNQFRGMNEPMYTFDEHSDDPNETSRRYYGGLGPRRTTTAFDDPGPYNQYFNILGKKCGFIGYVEGTTYFGISKQYRVFPNGTKEEFTPGNFSAAYIRRRVSRSLRDNDYLFRHECEIKVPKGTSGFIRLSSHLSLSTDQYQDTSTNIYGVMRAGTQYHAYELYFNSGNLDAEKKELFFNTCDGDVDLTATPFIICDLAGPFGDITRAKAATAFAGYITDNNGRPVEDARVIPFGGFGDQAFTSTKTDHNGYYFNTMLFPDLLITSGNSGTEIMVEGDSCQVVLGCDPHIGSGTRPNSVQVLNGLVGNTVYDNNHLATVRVRAVDTSGLPIPGIKIALEGRKAQETNTAGIATIFVRNQTVRYGTAMNLRMMPMQNGLCYLTTGDCDGCMPVNDIAIPACIPTIYDVLFSGLPAFNGIAIDRGLQPGATYPLAVKFMRATGHETYAQGDYTVTMPSIQQKQAFTFSLLKWDITGPMNLPAEYVKMSILIGKNKSYNDFVTWVVDKVDYVDASGKKASNLSADKIRLSIVSLYQHSQLFAFETNVKYEFSPGDRVEFIANGDGKIFNQDVKLLTFLVEGDFNNRGAELKVESDRYSELVITYSKDLKDLVPGAQIKILKPLANDNDEFFYETCQTIDLVNGEPVNSTGIVNTFDSYFVRRAIIYNDRVNTFTFPFLHHSPSDFWGDHCIDRGRVSVKNIYEKKIQYGRKAWLSDAFLENGNQNGLSTFSTALTKTFTGEQRGDIICAISREQVIAIICEYDNFLAQASNEFVRVGSDGFIRALSGESVVSDAQNKIIGNFGCQYEDVGVIQDGDGWIFWLDSYKKAAVFFDYNTAKDISLNQTKSYFVDKLQYKLHFNLQLDADDPRRIRLISGQDPVSKNIYITFFSTVDENPFVHSRHYKDITKNETIAFHPYEMDFPTFFSFTGENYGMLNNSIGGAVFFCFKNGVPYVHRDINVTEFNKFFDLACDQAMEPVVNADSNKAKRYLAMLQNGSAAYYCERAETSTGQISEIPAGRVRVYTEGKYTTEFLRDKNRKGGLYNGGDLVGFWLRMLLVRDNTQNFVIGSIDPAKQTSYSELDSIIVKFSLSENSAYGSNNK